MARLHTSTARGIACSSQRTCPSWNQTLLVEINFRTTLKMRTLANNVETGHPGKRGYFYRYSLCRSTGQRHFHPEPIYEDNVENSTTQSERDRKTRNEQLKNAWLNRCQKIELARILCGDKPLKFCDNKAVSLTFLSLGMEGRRIFGSQEPNIQIDRVTTKDLWESQVFTKQRNITFDRYTFLTRK